MKFKEVEIIKNGIFSSYKHITSYHRYLSDHQEILEKFSTCIPRKGDTIRVKDKNTHEDVFIRVKRVFIDYVKDELTIWC